MLLHSYNTKTCNGSKYIITTFNIKFQRIIHTICVYKSHFFTSTFFKTLKTLVKKSSNDCSLIILKYFIINILNDNNHKNNRQQLIDFVNGFKLKSQFKINTTKVEYQLEHIRTNTYDNECKLGVLEAYFHKLIYITFKLSNTLPIYNEIKYHLHSYNVTFKIKYTLYKKKLVMVEPFVMLSVLYEI